MEATKNHDTVEENRSTTYQIIPKRYFLACFLFLGSFAMYALRVNISIAIIDMTKNSTRSSNTTVYHEPEFDWDSKTKAVVLSAYSYGILFCITGEKLVQKLGGVTTYGMAILMSGILNVLNPYIVRFHYYLFLVTRILEGLLDAYAYVSVSRIWSRWAPKKERSKLTSIGFTGIYVGTAVIFPVCGFIAGHWRWPSTFHFTGGIAIVISSLLLLIFRNTPSSDGCLSRTELDYLTREVQVTSEQISYPWRQIFASKPLWALIAVKCAYASGYAFISFCLPLYIKDMTNMEIHKIGIFAGIPNVASVFTVPLAGYCADYLQNKNILNATQVHKLYTFVGFVFGAICLFSVALSSNFMINIMFLVFFKILISLNFLTIQLVPLYMSPNHSSLIAGIGAYGFLFGSVATPMLVGYIVTSNDPYQWSICLTCFGGILIFGAVIFTIYGSSEPQPWSKPRRDYQPTEHLL